MRLSADLVTATVFCCCYCLLTPPAEAKTGRPHFFRPIFLHKTSARSRSDTVASEAGTGRGLMKHLLKFRSMFQQPESNVIIITQTTAPTSTTTPTDTTTTTATSPTTTRRGRQKEIVAQTPAEGVGGPLLYGTNGIDAKISLNGEAGDGPRGGSGGRVGGGTSVTRRRSNQNKRRRGNNNNNRNNRNKARIRKIIKNANRNANTNNSNNNANINNSNNNNDSGISTNSRIQEIVNAFRRQGAVVYNR